MSKLRVLRAPPGCAIQDGGRRGHMHEGVPVGGARVPEHLARANRLAGNAWDAPAIEATGAITLEAIDGDAGAATEDRAFVLRRGEAVAVQNARYLAAAGGFDVPAVLGGHGALAIAAIGTRVVSGATLAIRASHAAAGAPALPLLLDTSGDPFRVVLGPDRDAFAPDAVDAFLSGDFSITRARDRAGARLAGSRVVARVTDTRPSAPMVRGAVQVPPSGDPIVLGPDHPTTGGYPVIAVVARVDHGRFELLADGARLRFALVTAEEARAAYRAHASRYFA